MNQQANIDIERKNGQLVAVSVVMPIWDKYGIDDVLVVDIPFLGIKTYAKDEADAEDAIEEAVRLFCLNSEKFGKGLETELKLFGWSHVSETSMSYTVKNNNSVIANIVNTGEQFSQKLELV